MRGKDAACVRVAQRNKPLPIGCQPLHQIRGMTLLELLVVVALLSIVALASTSLLVDTGEWKRQIETEARWDKIHDAIISQPNLYLNGSPYVRGYVADMGRLPVSIVELISIRETSGTYDEDGISGTPEITIDQPEYDANISLYTAEASYTSNISGGWRGPYLYTAGSQEYRDGWGRVDEEDIEQDAFNFGWVIGTSGGTVGAVSDLIIQSLGSDREPGGEGEFTEDFPLDPKQTMVSSNEWRLSGTPITFNINFNIAAPNDATDLQLRLYRYTDNGDATISLADDVTIIPANATFAIAASATLAAAQTVEPMDVPVGPFAALIWCTGGVSEVVFDGDCNAGELAEHSPVYFTLTHNTSQVTITWNLVTP